MVMKKVEPYMPSAIENGAYQTVLKFSKQHPKLTSDYLSEVTGMYSNSLYL